ncbi:DinB family protein [Armatimonas rosea]|uniref:DinB-like domain-containing protein n=1 Tax=Armatimonas rosea TaxID=685828 RepID=A0A7W9SKI2_ARMRO|nr:DinB family protein [Armatimonas rosea]MBB6048275.1 hypothetical protein [Armatimonas rosea]
MTRQQRHWQAIEQQKTEVLRRLEALTPTQAQQGDWSAAQVAYHLMRAEELLPAPPDGSSTRRKPVFYVGCALLRAAVSIPSKAREEPRGDLPLSELKARWAASRETLQATLATAAPGERVAQHPVFGALDAESYLRMLEAHLTYHLKRWPA